MSAKKLVSIVTPCFNEEGNIDELISRVRDVFKSLPDYDYEHIFADNCSKDGTVDKIKEYAKEDPRIKLIVNLRNYGPLRSDLHAKYQMSGDVCIGLVSDLQDPPEMIPEFLEKWEEGYKVVLAQKAKTHDNIIMLACRRLYYKIIKAFADVPVFEQVTGFGLYDKEVIREIEKLEEPEPSIRHLVAELGYETYFIKYEQPKRKRGKSSYNFFSYLDYALSSLVNTSRVPLRITTYLGIVFSFVSFVFAIIYLIMKLVNWNNFNAGMAPVLIGMFFIGGVVLIFLGIIGEYIGEILKRVEKRPLVIEKERVNFDKE
ncbi:MAG: glycosyltransferase family 2 protein [Eubacterium sp.]|nr:glycosyltransferase family 2 protein [Eubacterium sp.]